MSKFKTIEKRIKKFLINYSLTYYFYKIFKIFRNKKKEAILENLGKIYLLIDFLEKKIMDFM